MKFADNLELKILCQQPSQVGPGWASTGDLTVLASPRPAESPASARPNLSLNWATVVKYLQSQTAQIIKYQISQVSKALILK